MASQYLIGSVIRVETNPVFKVGSVATDPTTVTWKAKAPDGTLTTYVYGTNAQLVKAATGDYYVDHTPATAGWWAYRIEGTGTCVAVAEVTVEVLQGEF